MAKTKIETALTVSQAATLKGTTRQAIHYAIEHGKLKTVTILGRIGILPDELAKYEPTAKKVGPRR